MKTTSSPKCPPRKLRKLLKTIKRNLFLFREDIVRRASGLHSGAELTSKEKMRRMRKVGLVNGMVNRSMSALDTLLKLTDKKTVESIMDGKLEEHPSWLESTPTEEEDESPETEVVGGDEELRMDVLNYCHSLVTNKKILLGLIGLLSETALKKPFFEKWAPRSCSSIRRVMDTINRCAKDAKDALQFHCMYFAKLTKRKDLFGMFEDDVSTFQLVRDNLNSFRMRQCDKGMIILKRQKREIVKSALFADMIDIGLPGLVRPFGRYMLIFSFHWDKTVQDYRFDIMPFSGLVAVQNVNGITLTRYVE